MLLRPARSLKVEALDISEAGVCLTSPVELPPGTWCHVRILLPANRTAEVSIVGHVCFCIERQGAYRIGIHCAESDSLLAAVRHCEFNEPS